MTAEEVKQLVIDSGKNIVNVQVTTKTGLKQKQSLRINAHEQLCIGGYKSKFPNYIIGDVVTDKWESIKIIK